MVEHLVSPFMLLSILQVTIPSYFSTYTLVTSMFVEECFLTHSSMFSSPECLQLSTSFQPPLPISHAKLVITNTPLIAWIGHHSTPCAPRQSTSSFKLTILYPAVNSCAFSDHQSINQLLSTIGPLKTLIQILFSINTWLHKKYIP